MLFSTSILIPALLPVTLAAVAKVQERQTQCHDVHVFMARGNGEAYPGRVGAIANTVCNGLSSCDSENIQFDSTLSYCAQVQNGISSGVSQVAAYASSCPDSKLVLAGYSLGAHIVGDMLGGGGGEYYGCTVASNGDLSRTTVPGSDISVVLLFGNPRHDANEAYNVGEGSSYDGQFPRSGSNLDDFNQYANIIQDYCLVEDPICRAGGTDGYSHTTYMTVYADTAADFAHQILGSGGSVSSSSAAPSSSPSSSSSTSASSSSSQSSPSSSSGSSPSSSVSSSTETATSETTSTSSYTGTSTISGSITSTSSFTSTISGSVTATSSFTSTDSSSIESTITSSAAPSSTTPASVLSSLSSYYAYSSAVPFVFQNTATVATTSTYIPTSYSATVAPSTSTSVSVVTTASSSTPTSATASSTPSVITSSGGSQSTAVPLAMGLVTLFVMKVLAF